MPRAQVAIANRVRPGDEVLEEGRFVTVERVQRARGRKPRVGENLEFICSDGSIVKRNSTATIRIRRSA